MEVKKVYRPANTNNFGSIKPYEAQSESHTALSVKVFASASKALTQKAKKQKQK